MAIPILGDLINGVKDLVSEVVVDKDKRDQVNLELAKLEDQAQARLDSQVQGQIEVNKVEAASGSVFVAGWRPAVGWVGAAGLGYATIVQPLGSWVATVVFGYAGNFPVLNTELTWTALSGLLGIGSMRTLEKIKGVSTNDMTDVPGRTQAVNTEVNVKPGGEITVTKEGATAAVATAAPKKKGFKLF